MANLLTIGSIGAAFPSVNAGAAGGVGAAYYAEAANLFGKFAADPPDPNFRRTTQPRTFTFDPLRPGGGVTPAAVSKLNQLFTSYARAASLVEALIKSIERAQGARDASARVGLDATCWPQRTSQPGQRSSSGSIRRFVRRHGSD